MTIKERILKALEELAKERPVFHSEADFQFALALKLKEKDFEIRLEKPYSCSLCECSETKQNEDKKKKRKYLDMEITNHEGNELKKYAIELKYKTKKPKLPIIHENEEFNLTSHNAQSDGKFLFWKDVCKIHQLLKNEDFKFSGGFVIFLTNDSNYFNKESNNGITSSCKESKLEHSDKKRICKKHPIKDGIDWKSYENNNGFKFLILEVQNN